jgi:uncharacterized membrane protein
MKIARQLAVSAGAVIAMLGLAAWGLTRTSAPDLAVHWDLAGRPTVFSDRYVALLFMPGIAAVVSLLLGALPGLMPANSRIERSAGAYTALWMVTLFSLLVGQFLVVAMNTGISVYAPRLVGALTAVTLLVSGNWLGKIRYNYLFGIRTPWTLASERVWDKTHRFTGRWMVLAALVLLIASFVLPGGRTPLAPGWPLITTLLVCSLAPLIAGVAYSIVISRSSREGRKTP